MGDSGQHMAGFEEDEVPGSKSDQGATADVQVRDSEALNQDQGVGWRRRASLGKGL